MAVILIQSIILHLRHPPPQPSNRIVRREIVSQTQLARETIQNRGSVPSEKGPRIALIKPSFTAPAYANGFYKFYKLYNSYASR